MLGLKQIQLVPGFSANLYKGQKSTSGVEFWFSDPDQDSRKPIGKQATFALCTLLTFNLANAYARLFKLRLFSFFLIFK